MDWRASPRALGHGGATSLDNLVIREYTPFPSFGTTRMPGWAAAHLSQPESLVVGEGGEHRFQLLDRVDRGRPGDHLHSRDAHV